MVSEMLNELELRVAPVGYSLQDFLRLQGMTVEGYSEQLQPAAERRLKGRLALSALAAAEEITVTPEESQIEVDRLAGEAVDEARAKAVRDTLGSEGGQLLINRDLRTRKALARLREIVSSPAPEPAAVGVADSRPADAAVEEPAPAAQAPAGETEKKKKRTKKTSIEPIERVEET
jgi:FKBP-type peptidyl-prolyl cis-trans isomerase (trigger factor)